MQISETLLSGRSNKRLEVKRGRTPLSIKDQIGSNLKMSLWKIWVPCGLSESSPAIQSKIGQFEPSIKPAPIASKPIKKRLLFPRESHA
jgi:hypothetical protein